jgi:RNA polymerase sigma-70 factor (ECF subfamily)
MSTKGGHWAWEFAMQRRARLLAHAMKVCRNRQDAEDLVSETIARFFQSFGKVEAPVETWRGEVWLITTLTNLFREQCRKRRVQEHSARDPSLNNEVVLPAEHAGDSLFDKVTPEQLATAISHLSEKLREAFELHAKGMSYQQISNRLGIPVGTVGKRIHDARVKLRELLLRLFTPPEVH